MAANFGDSAGGFRHNEVISFINNEVLTNGGSPDFYTTLRSQSWNEIEDRLQALLADPRMPRMRQRACTWSALALGVRVAARQHEHQMHRIQQLQNQVEKRKTISWALASQLQHLRGERDQAASNLQSVLTVLQQTRAERDMLCQRLLQVSTHTNPLPQVVQPVRRDQLRRPSPWPVNAERQDKMVTTGAHSMPHVKTQMAALGVKLYLSGNSSTWAQSIQPRLPIPAPHPLPVRAPFPKGSPYLKPLPPSPIVRKAEVAVAGTVTAAAAVPKIPPLRINQTDFCAAVGAQKKMASLSDQKGYPMMSQKKYLLGNSKSQGQEKGPVMPQGSYSVGNRKSLGQAKGPVVPQWKYSLGNSKSYGQGKSPLMPKYPEKQQPQGQKAKQAKEVRASEFQHQGMSASPYNRQNWNCPWCKKINYSWRKFCYKCKKVRVAGQSGGLHPGQTHFKK